jgi:hypothetical protein
MRKLQPGLVVLVLLWAACQVEAGFVVTPGPSVSLNVLPFGGTDDVRYQQVYAASLFTDAGVTGPIEITGFGFSPNNSGTYTADVAIRLNQTTASVGALSTTLDDNINGSLTTVFHDPSFSLDVIGGDLTYTLRFGFSSSPFLYDPTTGQNLLLDMVVRDKTDGWAVWRGGDTGVTSRATDGFSDRLGLRTLIEFQPASVTAVPEPSSLILCLTGLVSASIGYGWRRRRSALPVPQE